MKENKIFLYIFFTLTVSLIASSTWSMEQSGSCETSKEGHLDEDASQTRSVTNNDLLIRLEKYSQFVDSLDAEPQLPKTAPKKASLLPTGDGEDLESTNIFDKTEYIDVRINDKVEWVKMQKSWLFGASLSEKIKKRLPNNEIDKLLRSRLDIYFKAHRKIKKYEWAGINSDGIVDALRKFLLNDGYCYLINGKNNIDLGWRTILLRYTNFHHTDRIFKATTKENYYYFKIPEQNNPTPALQEQGIICRTLVQLVTDTTTKKIKPLGTTYIFVPGIGYHALLKDEKERLSWAQTLQELNLDWAENSSPSIIWILYELQKSGINLKHFIPLKDTISL